MPYLQQVQSQSGSDVGPRPAQTQGPPSPAATKPVEGQPNAVADAAKSASDAAKVVSNAAKATADAVLTGEPAEGVTGESAVSSGSKSALAPSSSSPKYVEVNRLKILNAIGNRIFRTRVEQPHPRLHWASLDRAPELLYSAIRSYVEQVPGQTLKQLMKLCVTSDLLAVVTDARVSRAEMDWIPAVGTAVGIAFDEAIHTSLMRMGERVRALIDRDEKMPRASTVVASCPLDGVFAELLTTAGNFLFLPGKQGDKPKQPPRRGTTETREVTFVWMGKHDPALWHWIKVTEPKDATAEDVAHTPIAGGEVLDGSEQAYRIAANPPYFGIPIETARLVKEATDYAPEHVKQQLAKGDMGPRVVSSQAFLESDVSDETALSGAPKTQPGDPKPERTIPRIFDQLSFMHQQLDAWNLGKHLLAATRTIDRRRSELAGDPRKATTWQGALAAQERKLHTASSELSEFLDKLIAQGATPKDAASLGPIVRVLEAYAKAAGASSQHGAGLVALAEAQKLRLMLPMALVEERVRRARAATGGDPSDDVSHKPPPADPDATIDKPDLETRAADLRLAMMRGQDVDPDAVAMLGVDADETTLRARIAGVRSQLAVINGMADDVGLTKAAHENGMPTLRAFGDELARRATRWVEILDVAAKPDQTRTMVDVRRAAITKVEAQMKAFDSVDNVGDKPGAIGRWAKWAKEHVANERLHQAFVSLAIQLGVMIVTGQIVGAAMASARLGLLGLTAATDLRGAGLAYKAAEVLLHAGSATLGQGLISGEYVGGADIAENALAMVMANAVMKPFQSVIHGDAGLEKEIRTWAQLGLKTGKLAVEVALEIGVGIETSHLARRVVKGGSGDAIDDSQEWIEQGISIGAARFVGARMQKMHERLALAKAEAATTHPGVSAESSALDALLAKSDALAKRAKKPASIGEARALLVESRMLLLEEKPIQQARAAAAGGKHADPKAIADRTNNEADLSGLGPEFADVPLQLAHLSPVVDGHVYEGTASQISLAFETADKTLRSKPVRVFDPDTGVWHVAFEGRVITVRDRDRAAKAEAKASKKNPRPTGERAPESAETADDRPGTKAGREDEDGSRRKPDEEAKKRGGREDEDPKREPPEKVALVGDDPEARAAAERIKPKSGYIDVLVHGDANSFLVIREHVDVEIDHRALAKYLAKRGLTGQKIRLIACESGLTPFAVAQHLANKMHVEVLAPNKKVWVDREGNVGVGNTPGQNDGKFVPVGPKETSSDGTKTPMRIPVEPFDPSAPEHVPPLEVRFDHRERYSAANHDELQAKLGKTLEVDPRLTDGIRIEIDPPKKGVFGVDYNVRRVAVGREALAGDILAHAELIRLIEKYNGLVGKLRKAWDRLHGKADKTFEGSRYPHGSRGWVLANEIEKINNHIVSTQLMHADGKVDAAKANAEIQFLAGAESYFRDQLRTLAPGEQDPLLDMSRPDVGESTREAEAAGYKRPGQPGAMIEGGAIDATKLDPDAYYYRRSVSDPSTFELVRKPGIDAPQLKARVVGGKFISLEMPKETPAQKLFDIATGKELETLYAQEGSMAPFKEMIVGSGVASAAVVDGVAMSFERQLSQRPGATVDQWRHAVKEYFRERVIEKLADPTLDAKSSYQQMRKMVDGLGTADRGSLVEAWYRARYAPDAQDRRKYEVTRTEGENKGKIEKRVTDLIVGDEIREIKDIEGTIDPEQFGAYADLMNDDALRDSMGVKRLVYVFTKTKGAIANLEFLAAQMKSRRLENKLSVEVIDASGTRHEIKTREKALAVLDSLRAAK